MSYLKPVAARIAFALLFFTVAFASAASATTNTFDILMDLDNNPGTGCNASALGVSFPSFPGVEQVLVTTVTTTGSTAQVTSLQVITCNSGVFSLPAAVPAPAGHPLPWTVGTPGGTSSPSFIETYFPLASSVVPNPTSVRLGVLALDNGNTLTDSLLVVPPGPIVLLAASIGEVPTLSEWGLTVLGIVLALAAMVILRRRRTAGTVLLALLLLSAAGLAWAVTGSTDLDGATTGEWNTSNLLASAGPSSPHPDIEVFHGFKDQTLNALAFQIGSQLVFTTPQTITFTSTAPANAMVGGPTYNVTATASSGLPVSFTIDPSAAAVCSISGSTVSFLSVGTCVIDADQGGNANFDPAPQAQQSFAVGKGDQTISFTSAAPASATVSGPTYTVTATASPSGLPVSFTIDASAAAVCSLSGSTVSFIGVGTCVIDADQAGDANWNAAPQAQQSFAVGKGDQTIAFTSTAPASATVGGPAYTVTATASPSGLPVSFTIDASATSVCSISGSTVSFTAIGTCVIDANQAGDANYNAAPQAQQSFSVGKGDQTITFTSTAPASAKVGGPTYTVTATASSSLTVAFTIDATATSVCSISGSTVSFLAIGTCVIDANQPGDANWNAAPQAQQSFSVGKGDQTITFTSTAPASATVGGSTYTVAATASPSSLPVTFTIDATATSVCSISGSTVSFLAVGTCVIDANQAGNANYNAATQVQQSFAVAKGDQTISFTSTAPATAKVGGPTYTVTATASPSGLPVTFTIDATATSVCSISGSTVSFTGVGTCVIDANQAGNASYNAAPQAQQSFAVAKGDQTINFTSTAPINAKVGGPTYTATATASPSGLPVTFTIDATATSVCSISGSTVSFIGVGTCVIDANQAGNASYNAAPQVQQSFAVGKGNQTISFTSAAPVGATVNGPTYTVTATASPSGLPVTFTIDAAATSVCSIAGSTVSFIGAGTCVIDANQAGNANYNAAPQAQQSFPVVKGNQTISFTSTAPVGAAVGGPTYTVTATATSGLPVTFTIDATATSVCSISGSTVSFLGAGICVIDANQAGNANYNAAPQVQQSFAVGKGNQTISFTSTAPVGATVGSGTYTVTATATSGLAVTFTIDATATSVCSISGSTVSFIGAGTCVIDANQAGNANYNAAPQVQQSFAIAKANQTISFTSTPPAQPTVGGPTYTVTATATSGLPVTFTIAAASASVCSISGSTVSFIGPGTCTINANQAGNANYNAAPQVQQSFQVFQAPQITSANATSFFSTTPGTFTVTTTGFPTGASMSITELGALPSGVTFINNNDGTATLAGTPAAGTQGVYPITITASNGISPDAMQSFTFTVLNHPPQPIASPKETFDTIGNVQFEFKAAQSLPLGIFVTGNLVANFTDPDGPNPLSAIAVVGGTTTNGGKVDIATNGEFTFTPKAGDTAASDTFSYQVTDGLATVTRTVTINFKSRVWFVKNNAPGGGLGRSNDPFNTLAAAQTASLANDYIFVYFGDGTTTGQSAGITLKNGQHLIGEFSGLTVTFSPSITFNGVPSTTSVPLVAQPAPTACSGSPCRPQLDNPAASGNAVSATDVIPAEIAGLNLAGNTNGIDITHTAAFAGSGSTDIRDNVVRSAGVEGIDINKGGTGALSLSLHDNTVTAAGNGIDVLRSNGGLTITAFANNAITGNTGGSGIVVTGPVSFDSDTSNGTNDTVSGGATVIGASGNGVGANGMVLTNVSGDLQFTDLDIYNDAGSGLVVTGTGALTASTGTRVLVASGTSTFDSKGGPAIDINNASVSFPSLAFLRSINSTTTGLSLVNAFGGVGSTALSVSGVSSGQISDPAGASGTAVNISGGNGNVTLGIPITNTSGNAIAVANRTSDTVSFSGAISESGSGISLTNNTGATISFTGAITASTGANPAFTATGGGTVTATDTTSTLTTTTATALNVANTTIGASGLKFRTISAGTAASGPASGIILNTTGSLGGLTVSGSGSAGSGGTIQKTTGPGIFLTSTSNVSLSWMNVQNGGDDGVRGTSVTNFTIDHGMVSGNGNAAGEAGMDFTSLLGSASITNTTVTGSAEDNVVIRNSSGTLNPLTVTGSTFSSNSAIGNDGLLCDLTGTASMTVNVTSSTFTANRGDHFQASAANTASLAVTFTGNTLTGGHPSPLGQGITINAATAVPGYNGTVTYNISNNSINGAILNAIETNLGTSASTATMSGTISNNTIGTAGSFQSCSTQGSGIGIDAHGNGAHTVHITGNTIRQCFDRGITVLANDGSGTLNLTVTGNNVSHSDGTNSREGFFINAGSTDPNVFGVPDAHFVCLTLGGAGALVNTLTHGPGAPDDFRLRQRFNTTIRLPGYAGAATDTAAVVSFVLSKNTAATGSATVNSPPGGGFVGGAACP